MFRIVIRTTFIPVAWPTRSKLTLITLMQAIINDASIEELVIKGRMDIAINDYAPSGANNRHTPKPPGNS
jgi:hypothetical protein